MERVYSEVSKFTVKNLQKCLWKMKVDIWGSYKEDKDYFVNLIVDALKVSFSSIWTAFSASWISRLTLYRKRSARSMATRAKASKGRCRSSMWMICWRSLRITAHEESTHERSLVARGRLFLTEMNQSLRESDGETMTAILMKARDLQADLSAQGPGQSYSLTRES